MVFTVLDDASFLSVRNGLQTVCLNMALPASARKQAAQILRRFASGVRIFVLGPELSGKSSLCNHLVTLPENGGTAGVTRVFHASEQAILPDDSVLQSVQTCHKRIDPDILGPVSLIDVHIPSDLAQAARIYTQVFQEADVVIWCTREFGTDEADVWARAPDALKDHSFLVVSTADASPLKDLYGECMTKLQGDCGEEFHSMFVTAIGDDVKHRTATADASALATGVPALRSALKRFVLSGRLADVDSAMLFLDRYRADVFAEEPPETANEGCNQRASPDHPALPYLGGRAFDLAEMAFDEADGDMSDVLNECIEISEELAALVANGKAGERTTKAWEIAFEDAADKVVLLASENNTRSAADAVTILLQMRRDLAWFRYANACA